MSSPVGVGRIKLSDGATLKLKTLIVDVRESGFSPFGGVSFDVKAVGGVATEDVPDDVKRLVAGRPLAPSEPPREGWEVLDIVEQQPAEATEVARSSTGDFLVKVVAEAVMASRNTMYRARADGPLYWVSWVYKVSWRPARKAQGDPSTSQLASSPLNVGSRDVSVATAPQEGVTCREAGSPPAKEDYIRLEHPGTTTRAVLTKGVGIMMVGSGGEAEALIRVDKAVRWNEVIAEAVDLEEKVEEWVKTALSIEAEPPSGGVGERETWDWMDGEYARRKLGLPP
jgi:hypothetical protein